MAKVCNITIYKCTVHIWKQFIFFPYNVVDDGFGNQSYLLVHLLILVTCWLDFRQKLCFFLFCFKQKMRFLHVQWITYLIYKCVSIVNPRQLNITKLSTQFIYTVNQVPFQMCKYGLSMLLRQLNFSTIDTWFFYNWTYRRFFDNFSKIYVWSWRVTATTEYFDFSRSLRLVLDWFEELKSSSRKLRFFPTKCTNFDFRSQSQT